MTLSAVARVSPSNLRARLAALRAIEIERTEWSLPLDAIVFRLDNGKARRKRNRLMQAVVQGVN
jgi:predicted alpha/beta superfamily hydrolase